MSDSTEERSTFSIIHDDEFASVSANEFDEAKFERDATEWRDSWDGAPMKIYQNQIRTNTPQ